MGGCIAVWCSLKYRSLTSSCWRSYCYFTLKRMAENETACAGTSSLPEEKHKEVDKNNIQRKSNVLNSEMQPGQKPNDVEKHSLKRKSEVVNSGPQPRHHQYRQKGGIIPPPANIYVQVVGTGNNGSPKSVVVVTDVLRYLFNCGEGTQRVTSEHKLKISRMEKFFFTHNHWSNVGGLLGMALTMEAANVPFVKLHGPPKVEQLVSMSRSFAQLHRIQLDKTEVSEGQIDDECLTVEFVPITATGVKCDDSKETGQIHDSGMAVAYVCKPKPKPRSVSVDRMMELNLPRNKLIGELVKGNTVTLEDGRTIHPDDILTPAEKCPVFIIVEVPSAEYLECLVSRPQLLGLQQSSEALNLMLIVHMTPQTVLESPQYQDWINSFPSTTKHLVLNSDGPSVCQEGVYRIQALLNMVHPGIFPLLPEQRTPQPKQSFDLDTRVVQGQSNLIFHVRGPESGRFSREKCLVIDNEEFCREAVDSDDVMTQVAKLKEYLQQQLIMHPDTGSADCRVFPQIIFLGTGSSSPNKVRNVSSILVHLSNSQCILLDAGEDTFGQLFRHYGDEVKDVLGRLRAVYISHLHADHHMGLLTVLQQRARHVPDASPLLIMAPNKYQLWLTSVNEYIMKIQHLYKFVSLENLHSHTSMAYNLVMDDIEQQLDITQLRTCYVRHPQFAHGVRLTLSNGFTLVYSGDTMKCQQLIDMGQGCDLLIHEATMDDDLHEDAEKKKHSTTSEAIDVGLLMNAKFILLTHFSQRYAKIPIFNDKFNDRVGIAFDNMRVRPCDLDLLPYFTPVLKVMFREAYEEMEQRSEYRKKRRKLEGKETGQQGS